MRAALPTRKAFGANGRNALRWFKPWQQVMEWNYPNHRWFVGGETNITLNALDRHADGANRTKLALIWIGEDGSERKVTYYELRRLVSQLCHRPAQRWACRRATRVVIYMPLTWKA
jgi:acetyl-CoA synthetase